MYPPSVLWVAAFSAVLLLALSGCASYEVIPLDLPDALADIKTKDVDGVTVSVAILSDEQASAHFGVPLDEEAVQAIWLRVENTTNERLWLIRNSLDPDIYSPDEVALVMKSAIPSADYEIARQRLRDESIRIAMNPNTVTEGFLFAPKAIGGRYVDVRLVQDLYEVQKYRRDALERGEEAPEPDIFELRFGFAVPLPDGIFDYERLDPAKTYAGMDLPELSADELRANIDSLPCCATNKEEDSDGDPVNIVVVGSAGDTLNSLSRAGWSFTHRITFGSVRRLAGATLQGKSYPVAPVSDLYLFGRKQDFALQRARANISQRNHMRLWLAPFTFHHQSVWIGQVSRDIGIKLTSKSSSLTTHIIDPEVDLTREYLLHSLLAEGLVESFGFAKGARAATRDDPAINLVDDPYFSDGLRLVMVLSPEPVPYTQVQSLLWEQVVGPVAETQSKAAAGHVRNAN